MRVNWLRTGYLTKATFDDQRVVVDLVGWLELLPAVGADTWNIIEIYNSVLQIIVVITN
jgi:hypothetical protein